MGDRLAQTVNRTTTRYTLDVGAGLTQVLADGTSTYLYGNGRLAQYQTAMQYFGADALGSVRQLYDPSGLVVSASRYDPFGNVLERSGSATSTYEYTGEEFESYIDLLYLRARWYDADKGRFTQPDPILPDPMDPLSVNRFAYVNGNPINHTDPTGHGDPTTLEWMCYSNLPACTAAVTAIGGVVVASAPAALAGGVTGFLIWYSFTNKPAPLPYPLPDYHPAPPPVLNPPKPWERWQPSPRVVNPGDLPLVGDGGSPQPQKTPQITVDMLPVPQPSPIPTPCPENRQSEEQIWRAVSLDPNRVAFNWNPSRWDVDGISGTRGGTAPYHRDPVVWFQSAFGRSPNPVIDRVMAATEKSLVAGGFSVINAPVPSDPYHVNIGGTAPGVVQKGNGIDWPGTKTERREIAGKLQNQFIIQVWP